MKKFVVKKSREDLLREAEARATNEKRYSKKGYVNSVGQKLVIVKPNGYWKIVRKAKDIHKAANNDKLS